MVIGVAPMERRPAARTSAPTWLAREQKEQPRLLGAWPHAPREACVEVSPDHGAPGLDAMELRSSLQDSAPDEGGAAPEARAAI